MSWRDDILECYDIEIYSALDKLSNKIFQNEINVILFALAVAHNLHHKMIFILWLITLCRVETLPRFKSY